MRMKFIYSLTNADGHIFYIGKSDNIINRYKRHITVKSSSLTSKYIFDMLRLNKYPNLHVLHHLPEEEADKVEMYLIKGLTLSGHYLTNHQFNWDRWKSTNTMIGANCTKDAINIISQKLNPSLHG